MATEHWAFDTVHSSISFWVRHLLISKVQGRFTKWEGQIAFDEQTPSESRVSVEIDAGSVDTREPQRDAHLRSKDFFDVEQYPKLKFQSTRVENGDEGNLRVIGDLTMHGQTKLVTLEVDYGGRIKHPQMGERVGFTARTTLNRKDWGITFNQTLDTGGLALGEKVEIQIEAEATKIAA